MISITRTYSIPTEVFPAQTRDMRVTAHAFDIFRERTLSRANATHCNWLHVIQHITDAGWELKYKSHMQKHDQEYSPLDEGV